MADSPFAELAHAYDAWFDQYPCVYDAELRAIRSLLPAGRGLELGVGSGRFAAGLGVSMGLDPALPMLKLAQRRGVAVGCGLAEALPIRSETLDYLLMVTVLCFLRNPEAAFHEMKRVLRPGGRMVIAFIDRESRVGREYQRRQRESAFYRDARFYGVDEVLSLLKGAGFADWIIRQTLAAPVNEIGPNEPVEAGWGQGSFVVVSAANGK